MARGVFTDSAENQMHCLQIWLNLWHRQMAQLPNAAPSIPVCPILIFLTDLVRTFCGGPRHLLGHVQKCILRLVLLPRCIYIYIYIVAYIQMQYFEHIIYTYICIYYIYLHNNFFSKHTAFRYSSKGAASALFLALTSTRFVGAVLCQLISVKPDRFASQIICMKHF